MCIAPTAWVYGETLGEIRVNVCEERSAFVKRPGSFDRYETSGKRTEMTRPPSAAFSAEISPS